MREGYTVQPKEDKKCLDVVRGSGKNDEDKKGAVKSKVRTNR